MESIATPENHDIDFRLGLAAKLAENGRIEEALTVVQAVEKELDDKGVVAAQVYVALGALYSIRGDLTRALIFLASAQELEPDNSFIQAGYRQVVEEANVVLVESHHWDERGALLARILVAAGLASPPLLARLTSLKASEGGKDPKSSTGVVTRKSGGEG